MQHVPSSCDSSPERGQEHSGHFFTSLENPDPSQGPSESHTFPCL